MQRGRPSARPSVARMTAVFPPEHPPPEGLYQFQVTEEGELRHVIRLLEVAYTNGLPAIVRTHYSSSTDEASITVTAETGDFRDAAAALTAIRTFTDAANSPTR